MTQQIAKAVKPGRLANGNERGGGSVIHLIPSPSSEKVKSLCGTQPRLWWSSPNGQKRVCQKCARKADGFEHVIVDIEGDDAQ